MKKMIFLGILLAAAPAAALAGEWRFGMKAGVNVGGADYSPMPAGASKGNVAGFAGGAFANWRLGDKIYIQPEALYVKKGFTLDYNSGGMSMKSSYWLDCIDVPLFVGFVPGGKDGRWRIFAGPAASFLLGARLSLEASGGMFGSFKASADATRAFKGSGLGIGGGLGYDFAKDLSAEFRCMRGASNISRSGSTRIKTLDLALLLGLAF